EVDHHGVPLTGALGFYIERQAPLVVQRAAIIARARGGLDLDVLHLAWTQEQIVGTVDQDPHRNRVDNRRNDRRSTRDLDTTEAPSSGSRCHCCRGFQKITSFQRVGHSILLQLTGSCEIWRRAPLIRSSLHQPTEPLKASQ